MAKKENAETIAISEKPKMPIYKKWWLWGIVVVVLIGAFGGCQGGNTDLPVGATNTATAEVTTAPTTEPTEAASEETPQPTTEVPTEAPTETPTNTSAETQPEVTEAPTKQTEALDVTEETTTPSTEPEETMVWIPIHGGQKYHRTSTCSGMDDPEYVTLSEAEARGFTPCKRCY